MRNVLLILITFSVTLKLIGQDLNGFKYVFIPTLTYENENKVDIWGVSSNLRTYFAQQGFIVINESSARPQEIESNPCLLLICTIDNSRDATGNSSVNLTLKDCNNEIILNTSGNALGFTLQDFYNKATRRAFQKISNIPYKFNSNLTPDYLSDVSVYEGNDINFDDEESIREFLSNKKIDGIEGIWNYVAKDASEYKLLILKEGLKHNAYILEGSGFWKKAELKAKFEMAAINTVYSVKWMMGDKKTEVTSVAKVEDGTINFNLKGEVLLYKVFPRLTETIKSKGISNNSDWGSNGSGILISKGGYIITNNHVIEDADEIEVEFILNDEVQKFNAEIVQVDKVNDLAIIKIFDMDFDGVDDLPYNFKSRTSDVGTKVYAYGYPMALSVMGKEVKITDGIISSKSGFDGDITTYQISAPIQGGNSGGPLFDEKGNFLGINSSGLGKNVADNVGYTIKSNYVLNLIDALPKSIDLPSSTKLQSLPLTEQIKEISKYVVLVKVK